MYIKGKDDEFKLNECLWEFCRVFSYCVPVAMQGTPWVFRSEIGGLIYMIVWVFICLTTKIDVCTTHECIKK